MSTQLDAFKRKTTTALKRAGILKTTYPVQRATDKKTTKCGKLTIMPKTTFQAKFAKAGKTTRIF